MSAVKRVIRREINRQRETRIGTVISDPELSDFDGNSSGVFVAHIDIGAEDFLRNVPIKAAHTRFYAQIGQSVLLHKSAQGRWEAVGPGERVSGNLVTRRYDLSDQSQQGGDVNRHFTYEVLPWSYYATLDAGSPSGVIWNDGVTPLNYKRIVDGDGNPI